MWSVSLAGLPRLEDANRILTFDIQAEYVMSSEAELQFVCIIGFIRHGVLPGPCKLVLDVEKI
jgi:hypothetical protein